MPLPTAVTVPSPEMVATEVLPMCQVGVEEVPDTFSWYFSPAFCRVKSVRLRLREPELVLELARKQEEIRRADVVTLLHISAPRAYRLLRRLQEEGKLALHGKGAGAYYTVREEK